MHVSRGMTEKDSNHRPPPLKKNPKRKKVEGIKSTSVFSFKVIELKTTTNMYICQS